MPWRHACMSWGRTRHPLLHAGTLGYMRPAPIGYYLSPGTVMTGDWDAWMHRDAVHLSSALRVGASVSLDDLPHRVTISGQPCFTVGAPLW